jgi:hypothetical protein
LLTAFLFACDSNDDSDGLPSTPEAQAAQATAAVQSGITVGLTAALTGGRAKTMPSANCPQGGAIEYDQPSTNNSGYSIAMRFQECNGMTGPLTLTGTNTITSTAVSTNSRINGRLNGLGCEVTYDGFQTISQTNMSTQATTLRINGSYGAQCDAGTVTCSYTNVEVDVTNPSAAYEAGCRAS